MKADGTPRLKAAADSAEPFSAWLERVMDERGLSIRKLASLAGISATTVMYYRSGEWDPAGMGEDVLLRLSAALGVPERRMRALTGARDSLGPYEPPAEAVHLTAPQRKLLNQLIREMVARAD